ncbi:hypothetical protein H206_06257 [Candidatus Electrothrix aarhusensis]|uniref:Uncharacterized protein n=1 Tax=Candidatus Electrothrix aarhusensis TaxID=1859131 RepID=A0A3S3RTG1_9BACT|nr:hypothetical protein H206_06257 [Candidatus Electrothrix aarhusensis]
MSFAETVHVSTLLINQEVPDIVTCTPEELLVA